MIFKRVLEKGNTLVCKRFWKVFSGVFYLRRPRGCRIVLADPGGMIPLEKLRTSPRLKSGNQKVEENHGSGSKGYDTSV